MRCLPHRIGGIEMDMTERAVIDQNVRLNKFRWTNGRRSIKDKIFVMYEEKMQCKLQKGSKALSHGKRLE